MMKKFSNVVVSNGKSVRNPRILSILLLCELFLMVIKILSIYLENFNHRTIIMKCLLRFYGFTLKYWLCLYNTFVRVLGHFRLNV